MADFTPSQSNPELLVHERTYHAFSVFVRWSIVGVAVALTVLTLWFATPAGFIGGAPSGGAAPPRVRPKAGPRINSATEGAAAGAYRLICPARYFRIPSP